MKKLYLSKNDFILSGVCGGLGEYLDVDPTIIRLLCVTLSATGAGLFVYIIAALVIPEETKKQ